MNFAEFQRKLAAEAHDIVEDTRAAMREEAAEVLADAKERVPVITGALKASGQVTEISDGARPAFTEDYAEDVHENPSSTGYRYLESVIDERSGRMADDIAAKVKGKGHG